MSEPVQLIESGIGRMSLASFFALMAVMPLLSSCTALRSEESPSSPSISLAWRETFRTTETHSMVIQGLPDRTIGVTEQRGLAFFKGDDVASLTVWTTFETTGTNMLYRGYAFYSFEDQSGIMSLVQGKGALSGPHEGILTFIQGRGRFLGIKGEAVFTAKSMTPAEVGSDTYLDASGHYSLLRTLSKSPRTGSQSMLESKLR